MSKLPKELRVNVKCLVGFPEDSKFVNRVIAAADRIEELETAMSFISIYGDTWAKSLAEDVLGE